MPKLKVLFEAGPMLDSKKTGVGYYVAHLAAGLQKQYADKLYITGYYFNFLNRHKSKTPPADSTNFYKVWLLPGKLLAVCRRLGFQPFLEFFVPIKSDVIIYTNYVSLPLFRKRKTALVIYDLGFLDVPDFVQSRNLTYLKRFCPSSIRRADVIITISEFTKDRLKHYFPDLRANVVVTPIPPADAAAKKAELSEELQRKGLVEKSYILYLGTIEPRKNLESLVAAYASLAPGVRDKYSLVLAGGRGWKDEGILAAVAEQQAKGLNMVLTGYISDEEKNALYSNAACFVLPSHYEGFGMPIFEAMQHELPVAISDIPVFREVAGDAAVYFNKDDPEDIAQKIASVLGDKDIRQRLVDNAQGRLQAYSWEENADKVYQALR